MTHSTYEQFKTDDFWGETPYPELPQDHRSLIHRLGAIGLASQADQLFNTLANGGVESRHELIEAGEPMYSHAERPGLLKVSVDIQSIYSLPERSTAIINPIVAAVTKWEFDQAVEDMAGQRWYQGPPAYGVDIHAAKVIQSSRGIAYLVGTRNEKVLAGRMSWEVGHGSEKICWPNLTVGQTYQLPTPPAIQRTLMRIASAELSTPLQGDKVDSGEGLQRWLSLRPRLTHPLPN